MNETRHMSAERIIDGLVADLVARPPLRPGRAMMGVAAATLAACLVLALGLGVRADLLGGRPSATFLLREGLLALMGIATGLAAIAAARPAVGADRDGWKWATGAAALFPLAALARALMNGTMPALQPESGLLCLGSSLGSALAVGTAIVLWLRRGAPTSLARAGWLTGLAAGSLGCFAYGMRCPIDSIYYIGFWYSLSTLTAAVIGRIAVPRLVRW